LADARAKARALLIPGNRASTPSSSDKQLTRADFLHMNPTKYHFNRVILIEEDDIDIFVTEKTLSTVNFAKHVEVMNADVAYIRLRNGKDLPDFIFLGLHSRFKSGFDFLDELQFLPREVRTIKVVLLSVSPFVSDEEKAWKYEQVVGYFQKPIKVDALQSLYGTQILTDHD